MILPLYDVPGVTWGEDVGGKAREFNSDGQGNCFPNHDDACCVSQ